MNALEVRSLTLRFGAVAALSDVSFEVGPAELFAVIGPNGAGKTSLFNLLTRVYEPTAGSVAYFGDDMARWRPHHLAGRGIARTFQNLGLFPYMSVLDNVLVGRGHLMRQGVVRAGLRPPGTRAAEHRHAAAARDALDFVGLSKVAAMPVAVLPYGLRKRVELARALAMEPKLLLLDEPVAGMSRAERSEVVDLITAIRKDREMAIILVEHDMGVVMSLAERVLVLDFGKPIALGTPAVVQRDPQVIAAYLGEVA
ncbi:MAG: ABC transporter ATP-binding protein [Candidatus Dormibacteraeota bacterium]|nr:ABC transporter ATP-binding protein [Candidatus Dormibacteraeota bacterium]